MNDFILDFWNKNAEKFKQSSSASWGDDFAIKLEIETISNYIKDGDIVLDVGCANGFSSLLQCELHNLKQLVCIDYSENMIKYAQENKKESRYKDIVDFSIGDIRQIKFQDNTFDVVYTTRVLINLPNWNEQMQGIQECFRVAKPNGTIIFSEAFFEPFIRLNSLRTLAGLSALEEHDFNRYLKKYRLEEFFRNNGLKYENIDFTSVYYLGSRFLRDLVTDYSSYEGYTNPINNEFFELEKKYSGGNFGIQQAYVVKKGSLNLL